MNVDSVLSWAGSELFAADLPVSFAFGLMLALLLVIIAIALVVQSARSARAAGLAQADATAKLSAAEALAEDVRRMRGEVELAMREQQAAMERAVHEHNANCAATMKEAALAKPDPEQSLAEDRDDHGEHGEHDDHRKHAQKTHAADEDGDGEEDGKRRSFRSLFRFRDRDRD